MQFTQAKPAVGIVFDADFGNSIDDVLAMALLNGLQGKGEARLLSLSVSKPSLRAAEFCESVNRFYAGEPAPGPFGGQALPIGLATAGKLPDDTPMMAGLLSKQTAEGKPQYPHSIEKMNQTADPVALIRNAYSAQFEQNSITVLAGPAVNLVHVLDLPESKALIANKSRYLVIAAGTFTGNGPADPAIQADVPAVRRLLAEWPVPIVACGLEIGEAVPFPGASIDKDFAWAPAHPVVDAYKAYKPMPYDAPSTAMAAMLHAVRPQENYFKVSEPGTISVSDDGKTRFAASSDGKHKYLIFDPAQKEKIQAAFVELASAKPAPRPQRFRPQQKKQDAGEKKKE